MLRNETLSETDCLSLEISIKTCSNDAKLVLSYCCDHLSCIIIIIIHWFIKTTDKPQPLHTVHNVNT